MPLRRRLLLVGIVVGGAAALAAAPVAATSTSVPGPVDTSVPAVDSVPAVTVPGELPPAAGPLVLVPSGCQSPPAAVAVFEATVTGVTVDTARMQVTRVLAGSIEAFEIAPSVVDVRYGDDTRFLEVGTSYVVGAGSDESQLLASTLRDPRPLFGGDAVVGLDDTDLDCPELDDPVRTLLADGTPVDASLLTPLDGQGEQMLRAVMLPAAVALAALLALVVVKHLVFAFGRALRDSVEGGAP